ncbi:phosphoadenylylsulfate reductase (thioredoxin) [Melghirimyces profundicolus]|uniref:Adenosine 5'-phosphosulfate reductase n=1 Tax=Melghirimyces profundicolus TaxID=1242148 RepID=A0A2T6C4I8_9BACL|nr:phosphoadenylyl-sulfate reductase [Melghirimyces profundicolus]PTX63246.1 phosphoadenylylsulfate reductase (thioredoxin) [Melghirimyces profundicolus]
MGVQLTYEHWETAKKPVFSIDNGTKGALEVLRWAYDHYRDDLVYACSFGAESMVLIDLIARIRPDARLVFLDTGLHFRETYQVIDEVRNRYPELRMEFLRPEQTVEEQAREYGFRLWEREADECCRFRKIVPLERALKGRAAWISGLRREQSPTRRSTQFLNKDERFRSVKICPLIHWSWDEVWETIRSRSLPYNPLHDRGYPSIGCVPCTRPVAEGEDMRAGRWAGTGKTECGLHTSR